MLKKTFFLCCLSIMLVNAIELRVKKPKMDDDLTLGEAMIVDKIHRGCKKGKDDDCMRLGVMYELGEGVEKNLIKAKKFYKKACALDNKKGCKNFKRLDRFF